jgi:hypothetical protein
MLVSAHASCDAVHDDAYFMCFHRFFAFPVYQFSVYQLFY